MCAAGSVVTSSVRSPWRAAQTAVAHEATVLPTPPLPAKKMVRGRPLGRRAAAHGRVVVHGPARRPPHGVAEGRPRSVLVGQQRHQGPQPGDPADLAVEERDAPRGHRQLPRDLGEVVLLHRDPRGEERRCSLLGRQDPVDDDLSGHDSQAGELGTGAPRFGDRGCLGMEHEGEPGQRLVAQRGQRPLVLDLRLGDRGRGPDARLAGTRFGLRDALRPGLGQLEQAHRVAGGGRVEDHEVEACAAGGRRRRRRGIEEVGETVEGRHLRGARPGELLLHDPHDLGREDLADRRQRPVGVLGGRA